ncbi:MULTISPECIES: hypothetical protein [unclassified Rhizobium]|uniref:hypothetical protein n=1 Tax=unclassified Rhizobium TaxID=2613769 RepID=UPI0010474334|nr:MULTISPECIES: hypothetical protein [unclassified Rhizobium]MBB3397022.1 DNA polymerase III alpha subunit [Rhizobium sp. BK060]TCM75978.1 hypothetical protein EV291_11177 [Rhizobium sp. BK068]
MMQSTNDQLRVHELSNLVTAARVPTVVTNDVLFHVPERRILQDVVTCIRHNVTIDDAGFTRNSETRSRLCSVMTVLPTVSWPSDAAPKILGSSRANMRRP